MDPIPEILPPGPPKRSRWTIAAVALAIGGLLIAASATIRLPAFALGPGPARDVGELLSIEGTETHPSRGRFFLTTVVHSRNTVTILEAFRAWLDPAMTIVDRRALIQPGLDLERQRLLNRAHMEESKLVAKVVALRSLGMEAEEAPGGIAAVVIPEGPSDGIIEPGDIILAIDGAEVQTPQEAVEAVGEYGIGETVAVDVEREGERRTLEVETAESIFEPGRASIGTLLIPGYRFPLRIELDTELIGGPSGGLVFALTLVDALTEEDLTGGHEIAATGTIRIDGSVGPVGSVGEKALAAARSGADVFLVPAAEAGQAESVRGVRVLGVSSLADAIEQLRALPPVPHEDEGGPTGRAEPAREAA